MFINQIRHGEKKQYRKERKVRVLLEFSVSGVDWRTVVMLEPLQSSIPVVGWCSARESEGERWQWCVRLDSLGSVTYCNRSCSSGAVM